jgi:cell division protein FtsZ
MDAAMAAMASPLLEAGAIDGARGILINITGSSSLKLNEVNEASTVIQNAAHEECNIIFGAVQDERMGDQVKITVIATGFRQEMPERRARMLAESTLMADEEVPIRGRHSQRDAKPRFASEVREAQQRMVEAAQQSSLAAPATTAVAQTTASGPADRTTVLLDSDSGAGDDEQFEIDADLDVDLVPDDDSDSGDGAHFYAPEVVGEAEDAEPQFDSSCNRQTERACEPELVPVAASVFDDEFFRRPVRLRPAAGPGPVEPNLAETERCDDCCFDGPTQRAQSQPSVPECDSLEPAREVRLFAGANASPAGPSESDELDIPAFLRRSH